MPSLIACVADAVADPPKPVIELRVNEIVAKNSTVKEGSSVILRCSADANPPASAFWWSRDGLPVPDGSSDVLIIGAVARTLAGRYSCTAGNTLTPSGEPTSNVTGTANLALQVLCECVHIPLVD